MERDILCPPCPSNIMSVNVLATARSQYLNGLVLARPIGSSDPKQQAARCNVLLQSCGMLFANRMGRKTTEATAGHASGDRGGNG
jgi:hypothetical protein